MRSGLVTNAEEEAKRDTPIQSNIKMSKNEVFRMVGSDLLFDFTFSDSFRKKRTKSSK